MASSDPSTPTKAISPVNPGSSVVAEQESAPRICSSVSCRQSWEIGVARLQNRNKELAQAYEEAYDAYQKAKRELKAVKPQDTQIETLTKANAELADEIDRLNDEVGQGEEFIANLTSANEDEVEKLKEEISGLQRVIQHKDDLIEQYKFRAEAHKLSTVQRQQSQEKAQEEGRNKVGSVERAYYALNNFAHKQLRAPLDATDRAIKELDLQASELIKLKDTARDIILNDSTGIASMVKACNEDHSDIVEALDKYQKFMSVKLEARAELTKIARNRTQDVKDTILQGSDDFAQYAIHTQQNFGLSATVAIPSQPKSDTEDPIYQILEQIAQSNMNSIDPARSKEQSIEAAQLEKQSASPDQSRAQMADPAQSEAESSGIIVRLPMYDTAWPTKDDWKTVNRFDVTVTPEGVPVKGKNSSSVLPMKRHRSPSEKENAFSTKRRAQR